MADYVSKKAELIRFYSSIENISELYSSIAIVSDFNESDDVNDVKITEDDVLSNSHVLSEIDNAWREMPYPYTDEQKDRLGEKLYELAKVNVKGLNAYDKGKEFQPYLDNVGLLNEHVDAMDKKTQLLSDIQEDLKEIVPEDAYAMMDDKHLRNIIGEQNMVFDLEVEDADKIADSVAMISTSLAAEHEAWDKQYEHFNDGKSLEDRFQTFITNYKRFVRSKYMEKVSYNPLEDKSLAGEEWTEYEEDAYDYWQKNQERLKNSVDEMTASVQGLSGDEGLDGYDFLDKLIDETVYQVGEYEPWNDSPESRKQFLHSSKMIDLYANMDDLFDNFDQELGLPKTLDAAFAGESDLFLDTLCASYRDYQAQLAAENTISAAEFYDYASEYETDYDIDEDFDEDDGLDY